jgi:hypothetical protein
MHPSDSDPSSSQPSGLQVELGATPKRPSRAVRLVVVLGIVALGSAAVWTVTLMARSPAPSPTLAPAPTEALPAAVVQQAITWSPDSLDVILSPGETASRSVTFTSSTDLSNVTLEAVPEIAPFLTIKPSSISRIRANRSQTVQISFAIPADATLGDYDGTIHVRTGSQTLPQTVKVRVTVWLRAAFPRMNLSGFVPPTFTAVERTVGDSFEAFYYRPSFADEPPTLSIELFDFVPQTHDTLGELVALRFHPETVVGVYPLGNGILVESDGASRLQYLEHNSSGRAIQIHGQGTEYFQSGEFLRFVSTLRF